MRERIRKKEVNSGIQSVMEKKNWEGGRMEDRKMRWKEFKFILQHLLVLENYQICHYITSADGSWDEGFWGESVLLYTAKYM
jgi:hypothetical protein